MEKNIDKKKDIAEIRSLFRLAGEFYVTTNATDDEARLLYDLQNVSTRLYNQSVEIDKRVMRMKKEIKKRIPFRGSKDSLYRFTKRETDFNKSLKRKSRP